MSLKKQDLVKSDTGVFRESRRKASVITERKRMNNIGSRNPYALASAVALMRGEQINWEERYNSGGVHGCREKMLSEMNTLANKMVPAHLASIHLSYEKLFSNDRNIVSPLNDSIMMKANIPIALVKPVIGISSFVLSTDNDEKTDETDTDVCTQALPPNCTGNKDHWGKTTSFKYLAKGVQKNPTTILTLVKNDVVDDPVQGFALDCWLFAALSAVTWVNPGFPVALANQGNNSSTYSPDPLAPNYKYSIRLYDRNSGQWRSNTVSDDLILDPANALVTARSSALGETWPGIYEKAFAKFINDISSYPNKVPDWGKMDRSNSYSLDLTGYPGGNPENALEVLTGQTANRIFMNEIVKPQTTYDSLVATLTRGDQQNQQVTRYPTVACTHADKTEADADKHWNSDVTFNEVVAANHSYAVLGTYFNDTICLQDNPDSAVKGKFIVLRNPWGRLWGAEYSTQNNDLKNAIVCNPAIIWAPKVDNVTVFNRALYTSPIDGIFALRTDKFDDYFKGMSWVVYS